MIFLNTGALGTNGNTLTVEKTTHSYKNGFVGPEGGFEGGREEGVEFFIQHHSVILNQEQIGYLMEYLESIRGRAPIVTAPCPILHLVRDTR
jgi:hypothetical protein